MKNMFHAEEQTRICIPKADPLPLCLGYGITGNNNRRLQVFQKKQFSKAVMDLMKLLSPVDRKA